MKEENEYKVFDTRDSSIRTKVLVRDCFDTTETIEIEQDRKTKEIIGVTINRPPPRRMRVRYNVDKTKHRKIYEEIGDEIYDRWGKRIQICKKIMIDENKDVVRKEIIIKIGYDYLDWIYLNCTEAYIIARNLLEAIKEESYGIVEIDENKKKFIERINTDPRFVRLLRFVMTESESFTVSDVCRICGFEHMQSGRNYISQLLKDDLIYKHTSTQGGAIYKFKVPRETLERWIKEFFRLD